MNIGLARRAGTPGQMWARHIAAALLAALAWLCLAGSLHAATEDDFLPPEQAFRFAASQPDDKTIEVRFDVAPGYYMYRERFSFAAQPAGVKLGAPAYPQGKVKFDETFGKEMETYRDSVVIRIPVEAAPADGKWTLTVTSQGCADKGLCYPPMESVHKVGGSALADLFGKRGRSDAPAAERAPAPAAPAMPGAATTLRADDSDRIAGALASRNLGLIAALFFGLGLLLTFTPCVLPMVPILSSIVVGEHVTRSRALLVSLAYVLGMAVVYTAVGVAAGLLGEGLSAALQKPWVLGAFAALMVALALSMFGLYELQLPQRWQTRLAESSNRRQGGQIAGAAAMGAISALIVGPCVTAPLAGALAYIAQSRDAVTGGAALFAMALGMGVPLVLVGVGAGNLLPRAGRWMEVTKRFFGFLLLGVALWMLGPVLPAWATMLLLAALLLVAAVFLGAFDGLGPDPRNLVRVGKGVGVLFAIAAAIVLIGVASGGRDPLQPLSHLSVARTVGENAGGAQTVRFERVRSVAELEARVAQAAAAGKPVLLDFYADWCVSCKEMERMTFVDPRVRARLSEIVLLQADVTANNADDKALLKRFGLFGPPGIILFGPDGRERPVRVIGYQSANRFLESLERAFGTRTRT
ncbi:protein-disulfide reductase DsbD [Cupriavidus taiwanensis]|uniref:Thiol:disulfide interchange protein DsbD n=1 Tax=Cupriavidus taiwanensis TaxID=164546 RepID=A0A7Z7NJT8_9BURK|nr:protein-disulfide reductase DsbD [Cupriavidus taiwanensis]SOY89795.1 thiol:disulfide interchange protein, cytochrome c-type biogenesis, N-terminal interacts with and activates DsbC [Cupriavidus taiwanensis]SOZ03509.1 thiol:disulfide interchange protein, cytochrome c-type biogenesis, N-terminal interacts with and activates DsbC [Cupriavidus taiwanensis]SOZ09157.1 thiol:disulfide interchange protein, cytochrome c-type biogenesis, N-terminal interacts with and activates DsbC [Cupriavidus taiwane